MNKNEPTPFHKMSEGDKELLIFSNMLPKKHKLFNLVKEGLLNNDEIQEIILAASIASGASRKKTSNASFVRMIFSERERELEQISSEFEIRKKIAFNCNSTQKKYFRDCLINGTGSVKESSYIGKNIGVKFGMMSKNTTINREFQSAGINLEKESAKFIRVRDKKGDYYKKLRDISEKLNGEHENIRIRISELVKKSEFEIKSITNQFSRIKKGMARRYIKLNAPESKSTTEKIPSIDDV